MIRMTYECPETHEPLASMSTAVWTASDDTAVLVMFHCPKCSKRHAFSRADAILAVDAPVGKRDGRSSASSDLSDNAGGTRDCEWNDPDGETQGDTVDFAAVPV